MTDLIPAIRKIARSLTKTVTWRKKNGRASIWVMSCSVTSAWPWQGAPGCMVSSSADMLADCLLCTFSYRPNYVKQLTDLPETTLTAMHISTKILEGRNLCGNDLTQIKSTAKFAFLTCTPGSTQWHLVLHFQSFVFQPLFFVGPPFSGVTNVEVIKSWNWSVALLLWATLYNTITMLSCATPLQYWIIMTIFIH